MTQHGEYVLCTAGEVHLEKCMTDLETKFTSDARIHLSDPSFSLRETVVNEEGTANFNGILCNTKFFEMSIAILTLPDEV